MLPIRLTYTNRMAVYEIERAEGVWVGGWTAGRSGAPFIYVLRRTVVLAASVAA